MRIFSKYLPCDLGDTDRVGFEIVYLLLLKQTSKYWYNAYNWTTMEGINYSRKINMLSKIYF